MLAGDAIKFWGGLAAIALAGCAPNRGNFRPASTSATSSSRGFEAALYDLSAEEGHWGQVKVWCNGVEDEATRLKEHKAGPDRVQLKGSPRRPLLWIGFEINNQSRSPLRLVLNETHLQVRSGARERSWVESGDSSPEIFADSNRRKIAPIAVPLPSGFDSGNLEEIQVIWTLQQGSRRFSRSTTFARAPTTGSFEFQPSSTLVGGLQNSQPPFQPADSGVGIELNWGTRHFRELPGN